MLSKRTLSTQLVLLSLAVAGCSGPIERVLPGGGAVALTPERCRENQVALELVEHKLQRLRVGGARAFDQPDQAAEFFANQRLGSGMRVLPVEHLHDELQRLVERQAALASLKVSPKGTLSSKGKLSAQGIQGWHAIGPGNVGGRTRALIFDPIEPDTMYAAGVAGGVWKTTDAGSSWRALDDFMLNLAVTSLVMDPNDSSVLYAGTGEGFAFRRPYVKGLGVFKTMDAGETWQPLPGSTSGVPVGAFDYVNKLVVSPYNSQRVFAATHTGVWRSTDAGQTWSVVLANPRYLTGPFSSAGSEVGCTELVVRNDRDPEVLFACFGVGEQDGLFRSLNGGDTWQTYLVPSNQGRMTLALAPSNQDILYLLMADNGKVGDLGELVGVLRSVDGGDTFTSQVDPLSAFGPWLLSNLVLATGCIPGSQTYSQGWHDSIIAVDPVDSDVVWVGGIDLFRSDDGGQNFEIAGYWFYYTLPQPPPYYIHPDQHEIVFHPDYDGGSNQTMFVTNDGGLWRTQNAMAPTSLEDCPISSSGPLPEIVWENMNNGYGVTQFYHGDSAKDGDTFIAGAQDNGTNRVLSATTPDAWELIYGGDGGYVAIDPTDSQTVYVEVQFFPTFQKSVDGGATFVDATNGITDSDGLFITPFAMDQNAPATLWSGGGRPWRTTDGASSWQLAGSNFPSAKKISAIAIAPTDSNVVYMGFENGYIARTTNGLSAAPTWTVFSTGLQSGWVSSVAVDPFDSDTVYCTYSTYGVAHVMKSVDGGSSWTSIDGLSFNGIPDIPAHWIAVRPCNPQELYVGSELGVFWSSDGGATWRPGNRGLANTVVESLDFKDDRTLVAFTHGRGAFLTRLAPCSGNYEEIRPVIKPAPPGG